MIPGQLIAPGQLTDSRVNFASVDGLTPVTVHMSFSLPGVMIAPRQAASVTSRSHDDLLTLESVSCPGAMSCPRIM